MINKIEELESQLSTETDLQTRIDLLCDLAWELRDTNPGRSHDLSETAYRLAVSGDAGKPAAIFGLIKSLRGISFCNRRASNLALALSQGMQALSYPEIADLPYIQVDILQIIAITLGALGSYAEGLEFGLKALNLAQTIGDLEREASVLGAIGVIYYHSRNIDESLRTIRQALQINRELKKKREEALNLNNISLAFREIGDYDQALETSLQGVELAKEAGFPALVVTGTGTIAEAYLAMADFDQASHYLEQYLAAALSNESKRDEAWALLLLGETNYRQQKYDPAISYLAQALEITRKLGIRREEAQCHELLSAIYEKQGDSSQALIQFKLFYQTKETIFNEATTRRIANLQVLHQVETVKRDAEIHYLKTVELQREIEERKKTETELEKLAAFDPLTEVLNRHKLFALAELKVQESLQKNEKLSAVLLDVDRFKSVNDNYGHAVGDEVLKKVGKTLIDNLRKDELVGRVGGDEFVILLPGSDMTECQSVAGRLQEKIGTCQFESSQGNFFATISLGIAELDMDNDKNFAALLDHADQAMYAAKRAGRNCIVVYSDLDK